jgi:purine-nucleoside phosphorylase
MTSYEMLVAQAKTVAPRSAIILGSGLGAIVERVVKVAEAPFVELPGFAAPTVHGHGGRVVLGHWEQQPVLVFQGRMHFYEGHSWERATATVRLAVELGVQRLILTNAAGGIHEELNPGDLMILGDHKKLLSPESWRELAKSGNLAANLGEKTAKSVYSRRLIAELRRLSSPLPRIVGTYAALTGPTYETPAEIRALQAMGADAVGMSTAMEAEVAAKLGLEVAAISCITNKAAGLAAGVLDHSEVQEVAGRGEVVARLAELLLGIIRLA